MRSTRVSALRLFICAALLATASPPAPATYFGEKAIQMSGNGRRQTSKLFDPSTVVVREVKDGDQLRVSYGVGSTVWKNETEGVFVFKVVAKTFFKTIVLHEAVLSPGKEGKHRGWQNADIDLSKLAGSKVKISFSAGRQGGDGKEKIDGLHWGGLEIGNFRRQAEQSNVILISIDTLRADHLGLYGYDRPTSPAIDRIGRNAVWFRTMIANSSWTKPSHMSIFTGLLPSAHRVWSAPNKDKNRRELSEKIPTLAEMLGGNGFITQAFTGGGFISARFGFARGFSRYEEFKGSEHKDARFVFGSARRFLKRNADKRFFLFIHTFDGPHKPYRQQYFVRRQKEAGKPVTTTDWYDGGVRYVDAMIDDLYADLQALGLLENTLLIITSDHGEELDDRGYGWTEHGHSLYEEMIRVPLIIRHGTRFAPREIANFQAQHVDLVPTILDVVGIPTGTLTLHGQSLKPILSGEAPPAQRLVISEFTEYGTFDLFSLRYQGAQTYKLLYCPTVVAKQHPANPKPSRGDRYWYKKLIPSGGKEFYDLSADPHEKKDLAGANPPAMRELNAQMLEHLRVVAENDDPDDDNDTLIMSTPDQDADLRDQLRSLGY